MPIPPEPTSDLRRRRDQIRDALAHIGDMRPGSLIERHRKCGKDSCGCADPNHPGHPQIALSRGIKGKNRTRSIPREAVEQTRRQVQEYRRFRALTRELVEVSEEVCEAQLRTTAPEGAEKKGSARRSKPPSSTRSKS